ncbi:hypothetical protein ABZ615_13065 [Streptomyces sp. NPDC007325]|uniref:hypothetical protein n=1 Tax=Streptomyces sp. NPDC007325 TaxID=3154588 RepID=UPI003402D450
MAPAPRPLRSAVAAVALPLPLALGLALPAAPASATPASASAAPASAPAASSAAPAPAAPAPAPAPRCGTDADAGFPLETRIEDGPADYPAGGAFRSWELEVRNTTGADCAAVHPVLVLADEGRVLRPEQIRLEFYDGEAERWRPVAFEATEEAESIGAFTGFGGFSVPARRTVTVPVRLAFRADAAPEEVVVNAALVQRRGGDGDWVGRSGDYRLSVGPPDPSESAPPSAPADPPADPTAPAPGRTPTPAPDGSAPATPPPPTGLPPGTGGHPRPELAHTGTEETVTRLAPWAASLALAGAVLTRAGRRLRARPRP